MGRWLITTLLLASGSLPSAVAGKNSQSANGITGQILLGPTCPVARPGDAKCNDQPYETTMIIKTADGKRVTELQSNSHGDFRVPLRPGGYRLEMPEGRPRYPDRAESVSRQLAALGPDNPQSNFRSALCCWSGIGMPARPNALSEILHHNLTAHPTAEWTLQPFREALPGAHPYRYVIHDRDSIFSEAVGQGSD